jgi:hypothetical protein
MPKMDYKWQAQDGPQKAFAEAWEYEVMYGGNKGGGKSDVLLFEGGRQVDNPHYHGIIFRRTFPRLQELMDRAVEPFRKMGGVWRDKRSRWEFGSGAKYTFSHVQHENSKFDHQGKEYSYMAFDQLEEFTETQYLYLMAQNRTSHDSVRCYIRSSANPGNVGHCVPFGDVLTKNNGWMSIQDVRVGDFIATLDEKNNVCFRPVSQTIEEHYNGRLINSSSYSAMFSATPDHKISIITETKNKKGRIYHKPSLRKLYRLSNVTRLPKIGDWEGWEIKNFMLKYWGKRSTKLKQPSKISGDDYCRFMGWYLSEGYVLRRDKMFGISQSKGKQKDEIRSLLNKIGFVFNENKTGFTVYSIPWYEHLKQFGKSRDKFVPRKIKNATRRQIRLFIETAIKGDGFNGHYYTISKRLADDMQELGLKAGYKTYTSMRNRPNRDGLHYDINFKLNRIGWLEKSKIKESDYCGPVYCLGIKDLHRFYLRQNGTVFLSGNSWVKERFVDTCPPIFHGEKRWIERAQLWYQPKIHGRPYYDPKTKMSRNFIPSSVFDNRILLKKDPEYLQRLLNLPPDDRRALLEGDWDVYAGQFFSMFRKDIHGVEPFEIPRNWEVWGAIDYGEANPTSFGLYARDGINGDIYRVAEYYGPGFASDHALAIHNLIRKNQWVERKPERVTIKAPSDMWTKRRLKGGEPPKCAADYFYDYGLNLKKIDDSDRSRVPGWSTCKQFLNWEHDDGEVVLNPRFRYFRGECPNFEKYVPVQVYDDHKKEDMKKGNTDHSSEEFRYSLTGEDKEQFEPGMKRMVVRGV